MMMNGMILMLKWFADIWDWGKKSVIICMSNFAFFFYAKDLQILAVYTFVLCKKKSLNKKHSIF